MYNILSLRADAFYDAYIRFVRNLIKPIIRPIKNATVRKKKDCLSERNNNVIQSYENYEDGIKEWKIIWLKITY